MVVAGGFAIRGRLGRLLRFLGGAKRQHQLHAFQQSHQPHIEREFIRHLDHHCHPIEFVYRYGRADLRGDLTLGRFQPHHVRPLFVIAYLQQLDGANLHADRDERHNPRRLHAYGYRHFRQRFADHLSLRRGRHGHLHNHSEHQRQLLYFEQQLNRWLFRQIRRVEPDLQHLVHFVWRLGYGHCSQR